MHVLRRYHRHPDVNVFLEGAGYDRAHFPARGVELSISSFERFRPTMKRSFALRSFNRHETEINEHFWSFKVISEHAGYLARRQKDKDENSPTSEVFHARGPDARRIPPTVSHWLNARDELENWLRLSALVSATAYHETYLRQIIRSSLMSDPLVRQGHSRSLDGLFLLKKGVELDYQHEISLITKGEWGARAANFERIFGKTAHDAFPISELEEIRRSRNDYAHGFGRDLDVPAPSELNAKPARRLSHDRFIFLIGKISKSAAAIDRHLLDNFIGEFEIMHAFHRWKTSCPNLAGRSEVRAFQKYLHGELDLSKGHKFIEELVAYYNRT